LLLSSLMLRPSSAASAWCGGGPFGRAKSVAVRSATHFFVALACIPDLLKCAKHLLVAAILAGPPASHPISQGTGHHRADGPRQARSQGDVPLVAATPVQDLRFRANDLRAGAKITALAGSLWVRQVPPCWRLEHLGD
jgi:hypothetical protein